MLKKTLLCAAAIIGALSLSACVSNAPLQAMAQECQSEDAQAAAAEYPDATLMAQHDRLEKEADSFAQQAVNASHEDTSNAYIDQEVQARLDAKGLLDYRALYQNANSCWSLLANEEDTDRVLTMQQQDEDAATTQAQENAQEDAASTPPAPPAPSPVPSASAPQQLQPPTWMDTPYAAMVPPAIRGEPVGTAEQAVAPVAQQ
jgi:hypothetical protein